MHAKGDYYFDRIYFCSVLTLCDYENFHCCKNKKKYVIKSRSFEKTKNQVFYL